MITALYTAGFPTATEIVPTYNSTFNLKTPAQATNQVLVRDAEFGMSNKGRSELQAYNWERLPPMTNDIIVDYMASFPLGMHCAFIRTIERSA
jgi:hypothetical protein